MAVGRLEVSRPAEKESWLLWLVTVIGLRELAPVIAVDFHLEMLLSTGPEKGSLSLSFCCPKMSLSSIKTKNKLSDFYKLFTVTD